MFGAASILEEFDRLSMLHNEGANGLSAGAPSVGVATTAERALAEAVHGALRASSYLALRDLSVIIIGDLVELLGHVPSYHQKQLAQSAVKRVPGVARVVNSVEVVSSP